MSSSEFKNEIELRFPSSIYYADPYAAIRSVLGNDVEIISFKESNVILPDSSILINVEYSAIDFDLFKLYKIEDTKITSNSTQKIVATKLRDTVTNELLDESKIVVISNHSDKNKNHDLIFIKYLDRINVFGNNGNIKYYGFAPQTKSDVLHSYCSIVDTEFLSYHGNKLKLPQNIDLDIAAANSNLFGLSSLRGKADLESIQTLNVQNEIKNIQKLFGTGIETNNFTNANFDLSVIYNLFSSSSEGYLKTYASSTSKSSTFKGSDDSGFVNLTEIKLNDVSTKSGFINLNKLKIDDIKKALVNQKGVILLSKFRDNIMTIAYFNMNQNANICITENIIDNLMLVLNYDCYNLKLCAQFQK